MYIVIYLILFDDHIYIYFKSVWTHKLLFSETQLAHTFTSTDLHFKRKLKRTPTNTAIKS